MNILLIGNGFDLAHGLPTSYKDFLFFIEYVEYCHDIELGEGKMHPSTPETTNKNQKKIVDFIEDKINSENIEKDDESKNVDYKDIIEKVYNITYENIWLNYFNKNLEKTGNDWIDFESEIAEVIRFFETNNLENNNLSALSNECFYQKENLKELYNSMISKRNSINEKNKDKSNQIGIINVLEIELDNLCYSLQIYLSYFVEKLEIEKKRFIDDLPIDKIISFNYTDTYEKIYGKTHSNMKYNYIHGRAKTNVYDNSLFQKPSIVLGIDETLENKVSSKNVNFVRFKKYYQRIKKNVDKEYIKWLEDIAEQHENYITHKKDYKNIQRAIRYFRNSKKIKVTKYKKYFHRLYIIGHSLDVTDGDVLRTLIVNDNVVTTIYYHDEKSHNEKIENLILIIGKNELIKRTSGKNQTIFFVEQPKDNEE